MVNLNSPTIADVEGTANENCHHIAEEYNNLIWTMKAVDYMNKENQENLSRVHVLCCDKCDFLTISLKALQQHMTLLHLLPGTDFNNLTIYSCQECKCVSTELKLIQEHIKIFHNISTENSSNSSVSDKISKTKASILTPSVGKNSRKSNPRKLARTQLKMRKKLLQRKTLKSKVNHFLTSDIDTADNNNNNNSGTKNREIKTENMYHNNSETVMSQENDVNDPLDMSINSTMCPFKGTNRDSVDNTQNYIYQWKQEPVVPVGIDTTNNNSTANNNPLLTNPQTCIELIKLTLNQMLNKSNEQNRLAHLGFNPGSFLQTQFQLSPNLVPLLFPTLSQVKGNNPSQSQNEIQFPSKNLEMETIIQQQNLLNSVSPKSFEQSNHVMNYQQSPLFMNHKISGSPSNVTTSLFLDQSQTNGNINMSPLYNSKKPTDFQNKSLTKRSLKKQTIPTKVKNGFSDDITKFESPKVENSNNENLFNRSFLDSTELDPGNENFDGMDSHTNPSNKSSPNTNDKPHRQNFTSQQNRILSDWFLTHCDKPYPSTEDTKDLSQISGLNYSQVKKWFANKRARSSLNKKSHKSYCHINPTDSTMEESGNNEMMSMSPSSESHRSYTTNHIDPTAALDFTTHNHDPIVRPEN